MPLIALFMPLVNATDSKAPLCYDSEKSYNFLQVESLQVLNYWLIDCSKIKMNI